ncbi:MAG: hypothetical protein AB8G11_04040 [Saprospiraceae bacterium]
MEAKVIDKMPIGSTKFLFHLMACLRERKDKSSDGTVRCQTRFRKRVVIQKKTDSQPEKSEFYYYNLWFEKEWHNALGKKLFSKTPTTYVMLTPLRDKATCKRFLTGKGKEVRLGVSNDILNAHFKTIGKDYSHFIFQEDINGRLWIIRPVIEFFLSFIDTGMFFRGLKYKDDTYTDEKKDTVNIIEGNFFYDWDLTLTNEARLRFTTDRYTQGDFVKDSRAMSMAEMSDYFRKTVTRKDNGKKSYAVFLNMLKKYGIIHQFTTPSMKVTMWNPAFSKEHHGHFGTFKPKKGNDDFYNIYGDKKYMGVLQRIMFEPGVFQEPINNQKKLF